MWDSPVPLRPHHGLCMAFFVGEGYSEGFSRHMGEVLSALCRGGRVRLECAADTVCAACPENRGGTCRKPDLVAGYDRAVLALCGLREGAVLPFDQFTALVQSRIIAPDRRGEICGGCQWDSLCRTVPSRWAGEAVPPLSQEEGTKSVLP